MAYTAQQTEDRDWLVRVSQMPRRGRFEAGYWVVGAVAVFVALAIVDFLLSPGWRWHVVGEYLFSPPVIEGLLRTLGLTGITIVLGLIVGLIVALARMSRYPAFRFLALVFIWVVRALPMLVVLLFIYFFAVLVPTLGVGLPGLPPLWEIDTKTVVTQFGAAVIGLSLYFGGKTAEIFRGGFMAVAGGQRDGVWALGLTPWTAVTRVTGPQATRVLIPPMANEVVTMFKNTSIVTVIGYGELLTTVQKVYSQTGETIPMLAVACLWYLVLTSLLMVGQIWLERRFGRGFDRRGSSSTATNRTRGAVMPPP